MREEQIKYLCCPRYHDELVLKKVIRKDNGEIDSGVLVSTNGIEYSIDHGIPNLIPFDSNVTDSGQNKELYKRLSVPYDVILQSKGIDSLTIAQMDALRFSIFSKTKEFCNKYLSGIVLEIGAGKDYLREEFNGLYKEWISLDYDLRSETIDLRGDGQFLPFRDGIFNTIVSIDVLEHVPDPEKFVSEIYRVTQPNGLIILSTPFFFWHHEEPYDFFRFSKYGIRKIFERNNFEVIDVIPTAGVVSTLGFLFSVLITKLFQFSKILLRFFLRVNKIIQLKLLLPIDKKFDKKNKFAQGHFIIAKRLAK